MRHPKTCLSPVLFFLILERWYYLSLASFASGTLLLIQEWVARYMKKEEGAGAWESSCYLPQYSFSGWGFSLNSSQVLNRSPFASGTKKGLAYALELSGTQ